MKSMAPSNTSVAASTVEPSAGKATALLVEHLSRHDASALAVLLGPSTMGLLGKKLAPSAISPKGLAYFLVKVHGDHEVLRRPEIRELLLSKLSLEEATGLCELLQFDPISPHQTLQGINFNTKRNLELLGTWYGVESDELQASIQLPEGSQKAVAAHKLRAHQLSAYRELRRSIANPSTTLVHMPFGAGKLRLVATAALDFFRSADDDKSVVWLAPGPAMCEEAFLELRDVWKQLGSRDITLLQLYGDYPTRDLDRLGGAIVVIDILRISKDDPALQQLGASTAIAVLADAQDLVHPVGAEIIQKMSAGGPFPLVGVLATSGDAIPQGSCRDDLKRAFTTCITVADEQGTLQALRDFGDFSQVAGTVVNLTGAPSPSATGVSSSQATNDSSLDFDPVYVSELDGNVGRNECLLTLLQKESQQGGRIVFYATTAASARLFAGLLHLLGIPAASVTADEFPAARTLAIQRLVARGESGILCVHGFLLAGSSVPNIASCVMASPIRSKALFLSTIGRLVQARDASLPALRLIVAADSQADVALVNSLGTWSTLGSWPEPKS
jgi:hypothetical protein